MRVFLAILACLIFHHVTATANERFYRNISETGDYGGITINTIFKDSAGYVWLGAPGSVLRFDGAHIVPFQLPAPADRLTAVTAITEIPGKSTFIGTRRGLFGISADSIRSNPAPIISDIDISGLCMVGNDILIGTPSGIIVYDNATGETSKIMMSGDVLSRSNFVTAMRCTPDNIYAATRDGIFTINPQDRSATIIAPEPRPASEISSLTAIDGMIFIGTSTEGLLTYDTGTRQYDTIDVGCNVVTSLDTDPDGDLYVGTDGKGVVKIDPRTLRITDTIRHRTNNAGTPQSNQVYSLLVDDLGLLWIGYYQHGADYTLNNFGNFEIFNDPRYFNSRGMTIRTITQDNDYTSVGTREGIILIDRSRELMSHYKRPDLRSDMVIAVKRHGHDFLIGTYGGGMYRLDPATRRISDFDTERPDPFINGHIFSIASDQNGDLWIGTSSGLFHYRDYKLVHHFTSRNSPMPAGNVYEVYFDSHGKGWICTESGMAIYDPVRNEIRTDIFPDGFINHEKIRSVYEDSGHSMYFLPEKGSVTISDINLDNIRQFDIAGDADAKSIIEDCHGYIWITSDRGIVRWDKDAGTTTRFGFAEGIPSINFTQCTPSIDSYGNLWFGNSEGLLKLDTHHSVEHKSASPAPRPTDVLVEGAPYTSGQLSIVSDSCYEITFDNSYANITIGFGAFSYTAPEAVNFEYSLDGKPWHEVARNLEITLYNLSSGTHSLKVRNGDDPDKMTELRLYMPLSTPFKIIIALLVMTLAMAVYIVSLKLLRHLRHAKDLPASTVAAVPALREDTVSSVENEDAVETQEKSVKEKYRSTRLSATECDEIVRRIRHVIEEKKPFTDPDLKIGDLAALTGISSYKLSYVFSQHLNEKFYDYINRFRVDEFKLIANQNTRSRYTLSAMAEKAGFSSRTSFFRHFKDLEGISPGEYLKRLENGDI